MTDPPAHRNPDVLRWLCAYTTSVTGDVVCFLALSWTAARAGGPATAGLVVAAGALPRALLMLAGGAVADRCGPRRVAIGSDAARCLVVLAAAGLLVRADPGVWLLLPVAAVFGVVDALFMPAVGALPPRLARAGELARVQGMRGLSIRASNAVGPLAGGGALAAGGAGGAFAAAGALFGASLALLARVRTPYEPAPPGERSGTGDVRAGLRYLRGHPVLAPLVAVIALSELCFSGPVAVGLVLLADERGWGAAGMGWIATAFSIGGAGAALLMAARGRMPRPGLTLSAALLLTAVATTALGYAATLPLAVGTGALAGLGSGVTSTLTGALVQTAADPRCLGRITSVTTLCTLGPAPVLLPLVGLAVAAWGAAVFFAGCGAVCVLAAAVGFGVRALRRAEFTVPTALPEGSAAVRE